MVHAQYEFGKYLQTLEATDNTMKERTLDAIAMGPIGNRQGEFYALNLSTVQHIKRLSVTPLPTPQSVTDKVTQLAVMKELQQMHDLEIVEGMEPSSVTPEMRKKTLSYLMLLKRKKSGKVKG